MDARRRLFPSARSAVEPFLAMDVLREAGVLEAQGRRIMHLEVGEPDFPDGDAHTAFGPFQKLVAPVDAMPGFTVTFAGGAPDRATIDWMIVR